jgi:hypothetical protein
MTLNKLVLALGTLLAACSGAPVPGAVAPTARACQGGSVRGDAELARYARCETVSGDLDITAVTDLRSLADLRSVKGTLAIHGTERLYSLSGLENLGHVETLIIERNRGLINAEGLKALNWAEKIRIVGNPRLTSSGGSLDGLRHVAAEVSLVDNVGLSAEGFAMESRVSAL